MGTYLRLRAPTSLVIDSTHKSGHHPSVRGW
jgi:hypothetical protein